jgi:hypothetical protein
MGRTWRSTLRSVLLENAIPADASTSLFSIVGVCVGEKHDEVERANRRKTCMEQTNRKTLWNKYVWNKHTPKYPEERPNKIRNSDEP